jgi:serpin B
MQSGIREESSNSSGPSGDFYNMARYQSISDLISNFTWAFHKALSETDPHNFAYSPVTVSSCVFAILQGADGATRDELSEVIVTGGNDDHFTEEFSRIIQLLKKFSDDNNNNKEKSELDVAQFETCQRLFYSIGDSILDEYTKLLNTDFGIDTQAVDFTANSNTFRKISLWLENSGGVKRNANELRAALKLDALNRLMFISSMKFSGALDLDLHYSEQEAFFYVNSATRVSVKMLCAEKEISYAVFPQLDARAVSIPYQGDRCSLVIFLPKGKGGITQLEHCLRSYKTLAQVMNTFQSKRKLQFRMPYFRIDRTINMNEALKTLGAATVFDADYADFARLEEVPENIFISGVVHSVQVDIHTQQKALSSGFDLRKKKEDDSLEFHVENPFFFLIYDQVSKTVLVAGRISNPLET